MMIAITIGVIILIIANIAVCFGVFRSISYSRNQKIAQAAIVFLLPIAGVIIVLLFLRETATTLSSMKENPYADRDDLKAVGMNSPGPFGPP